MKRISLLDDIRGITILSMILYHAVWDLVYMFGVNWTWFYTSVAYVWQQSICWTFILLSGFCYSLGEKKLKRGFMVLGAGALVSLVTELVTPEQRIRFGVLTMLGTSMLLTTLLYKILRKVPAVVGCISSGVLFILLRNINHGYLGFEAWKLCRLPDAFYHGGDILTYIGFTDVTFFSADYFSILPWYFLFLVGYFTYQLAHDKGLLDKLKKIKLPKIAPYHMLGMIGRHSLIIYMLHQPMVYVVLVLVMQVVE